MDCHYSGSSKQRRDSLKVETEILGVEMPFEFGKLSQLRILKAACTFLKKEKHLSSLRNQKEIAHIDRFVNYDELVRNEALMGFIVCFTKKGELIYISENAFDYLGFKTIEILLSYDFIYDMAHEQDRHHFKELEENYLNYLNEKQFSFYSMWFASKIKRKQTSFTDYKLFKMTGHFDAKSDLYIATCMPILSAANREVLCAYNAMCFASAHRLNLQFYEMSSNGENLLGYSAREDKLNEKTLYEFLNPDCFEVVRQRHSQLLATKNTKGFLDVVQVMHKNGHYVNSLLNMFYDNKGFIICKYQIMSQRDIIEYSSYVVNIRKDWFTYTQDVSGNQTFSEDSPQSVSEFNCNEENSCSNNMPFLEANSGKRKADFDEAYSDEAVEFNLEEKRLKKENPSAINESGLNLVESFPQSLSEENFLNTNAEQETVFDLNEEFVINNIKEFLEKEMSNFQDSQNFSNFTETGAGLANGDLVSQFPILNSEIIENFAEPLSQESILNSNSLQTELYEDSSNFYAEKPVAFYKNESMDKDLSHPCDEFPQEFPQSYENLIMQFGFDETDWVESLQVIIHV